MGGSDVSRPATARGNGTPLRRAAKSVYIRRAVMRGEEPGLLRRGGVIEDSPRRLRSVPVGVGELIRITAFAWTTASVWLFAKRSTAQEAWTPGRQVWSAAPSASVGAFIIDRQWFIAWSEDELGNWCSTHCAPHTEAAAWVTSTAYNSANSPIWLVNAGCVLRLRGRPMTTSAYAAAGSPCHRRNSPESRKGNTKPESPVSYDRK